MRVPTIARLALAVRAVVALNWIRFDAPPPAVAVAAPPAAAATTTPRALYPLAMTYLPGGAYELRNSEPRNVRMCQEETEFVAVLVGDDRNSCATVGTVRAPGRTSSGVVATPRRRRTSSGVVATPRRRRGSNDRRSCASTPSEIQPATPPGRCSPIRVGRRGPCASHVPRSGVARSSRSKMPPLGPIQEHGSVASTSLPIVAP